MAELFFLPEAIDIVSAGVSIHGTGFDREALVPSIIVLVFFAWCMKGAPVNEKAQGAFSIGWIILIGFIIFGLLAPGESFGAARGWPSYATDGAELSAYLDRPKPAPWSGLPVTPLIILAALWVLVPSDSGKAKAKPKAESKPDPIAQIVMDSLRNGKRALIPILPIILLSSAVANAGMVGNLFESDGQAAQRKAQADAIQAKADIERLRAELDAERQRALLLASGYAPPKPEKNMVPMAVVFVVAVMATLLYWRELRTREAREEELRRLQVRLAVAESRRREDSFFTQARQIAYMGERHGR